MKQKVRPHRSRKREARIISRTKRLDYEKSIREYREEEAEERTRIIEGVPKVFREDNKKNWKPDKKPGPEKFLKLYSFITSTPFDTRYSIPSTWKPHSFNERKQHLEFIKSFIYPYPLPETLIWASITPLHTLNEKGHEIKNPDHSLIKLARKLVNDIVSGESFYKKNSKFFSKAEAHHFLTSKLSYTDLSSVITLYFYAKCRARSMKHKMSMMVADVFALKFLNHFKNRLVEGFLELIVRTPDYQFERGIIGDISDFVLEKIRQKETFSFSGRTIFSVIKLTNEWHEDLRREAENERLTQRRLHNEKQKSIETSHWKGMGIAQFRYETIECIWTVTELRTAQDLVNEGRKMRNCVSSYVYSCASGYCSIFTVECVYLLSKMIEKTATLEVNRPNRNLVQAKGKYNTAISLKTMNIINRWAEANGIKVKLLV